MALMSFSGRFHFQFLVNFRPKMFRKDHSRILFLFELYGVLPQRRNFSRLMTIFWMTFGFAFYIWVSFQINLDTPLEWIQRMGDVLYFLAFYCSIPAMELFILFQALRKMSEISEIYESFEAVDVSFRRLLNVKFDNQKSSRRALWKTFTVLVTALSLMLIVFLDFIDAFDLILDWLQNVTVFHMIHVSTASFIFFVDQLNERLVLLCSKFNNRLELSDLQIVNSIHTKLFELSRSMMKAFGLTISIVVCCYSFHIFYGLYMVFLKASAIDSNYSLLGKTLTFNLFPIFISSFQIFASEHFQTLS